MSTVAERAPGRVAERTGGRRRFSMARLLVPTLAWIAAIGFFFPVFWMFLTGFKQEADAFTSPPKLFFAPTLEQYRQIFARDFAPFLINSASATVVSTLLVLALAIPCAYGLAVKPVEKWRDVLFFFISTRFLPVVGAIVPIYVIARDAKLLDTVTALIILYTAMNMPIAVWMLRSFFMEVPKAIMEAARIDGASLRQELIRIVLPLVAPGIAATALICVIFAWNEFFFAVNLTSPPRVPPPCRCSWSGSSPARGCSGRGSRRRRPWHACRCCWPGGSPRSSWSAA
jgi:sorbitol/mannitol transport system permease protein